MHDFLLTVPAKVRWNLEVPRAVLRVPDSGESPVLLLIAPASMGVHEGARILNEQPMFWKKVRQLWFAFNNKTWQAIEEFYGAYGLLRPEKIEKSLEPWDIPEEWEAKLSSCRFYDPEDPDVYLVDIPALGENLEWFQRVTALVELLRAAKHEAIFDYYFPKQPAKREFGFDNRSLYELAGRVHEDWIRQHRSPQALLEWGWSQVAGYILPYLQQIQLETQPVWDLTILCDGALDAAVFQWLQKEIAAKYVNTCAADGCSNPVPLGRIYCSDTCRRREKMRRYRAKKKGGDSSGQASWP